MARQSRLEGWPTPHEGQAQITLLGSPHLANPGNDEHNLTMDDTLAPDRQDGLAALCTHLQQRPFDKIALEVRCERQAVLDSQYATFREKGRLNDEDRFPDGPVRIRSEAAQIGFRLADTLDHERVHAVDSHPDPPDVDADWAFDNEPDEILYPLPDMEELVETQQRLFRESSILEGLRYFNRSETLQTLHAGNIGAAFASTEGDDYTGSKQVGYWYERNARMVENLRRVTDPDQQTLFIVGGSHVLPVKQLTEAAPSTCPRSVLPLFPEVPSSGRETDGQ